MRVAIAAMLVVSSFVGGFSQQAGKTNLPEERKPIGCEGNSAYLDAASDRLAKTDTDVVIIAVSRLGTISPACLDKEQR